MKLQFPILHYKYYYNLAYAITLVHMYNNQYSLIKKNNNKLKKKYVLSLEKYKGISDIYTDTLSIL